MVAADLEIVVTLERMERICRVLYESFQLEIRKGDEQAGTEGRPRVTLWYLPFGRSTNNQFGEVIKQCLSSFSNSYDDLPLSTLEKLLMESALVVTGKPHPELPVAGEENRAFAVSSTKGVS